MIYLFAIGLILSGLPDGSKAGAVTIFRLGGADLPPPELDESFEFVQWSWDEVDENQHGRTEVLAVTPDFITPQKLNPEVNLTPLLEELGGQVLVLDWLNNTWHKRKEEDAVIFDGDPHTAYLGDGHYVPQLSLGATQNKYWIFDFGARFSLVKLRFYPRQEYVQDRFVERFLVGVNDGDPLKDGTRDYQVKWWWGEWIGTGFDTDLIHDISENTSPVIELEIPPQPVRFLYFEAPENTRGIWEIAEFEIYGEGPTPLASYISNVIDLGGRASLGRLSWSAQVDSDAVVDLRMRCGDDPDPHAYWRHTYRGDERSRYDGQGKPLDLQTYNKLEKSERAGITHDTENWENWSMPFDIGEQAEDMVCEKPRQFVQFKIDFTSTLQASGQLDYLQFTASLPPMATQILAEITPTRAPAGEITRFTYRLLPRLEVEDLGFDRIAIRTPVRPQSIEAVRRDGQDVAFEIERLDENGFELQIPRVDQQATNDLIEVVFHAEVFKFGTVFSGWVFDSTRPHEVRQAVTAGNADPLVDSNTLSVELAVIRPQTINAMRLQPAAFTPNGDGINDELQIEFDLLNLVGAVSVTVDLYDLSGRKLGRVFDGVAASGRFVAVWDGRDEAGHLLAPGLYIMRLAIDADQGLATAARVVSLAY